MLRVNICVGCLSDDLGEGYCCVRYNQCSKKIISSMTEIKVKKIFILIIYSTNKLEMVKVFYKN